MVIPTIMLPVQSAIGDLPAVMCRAMTMEAKRSDVISHLTEIENLK